MEELVEATKEIFPEGSTFDVRPDERYEAIYIETPEQFDKWQNI